MAFTESSSNGQLNSTTPVTIVASPSASTRRLVRNITIYNADTAAVVLTVKAVFNATSSIIWSGTLQIGDTWVAGAEDFYVLDATNKSITAVLGGAVATIQPWYTSAWGDST